MDALYCVVCMTAFPDRNAREAATILYGHAVCVRHWEDLLVNDGIISGACQDATMHAVNMVARGEDPFA